MWKTQILLVPVCWYPSSVDGSLPTPTELRQEFIFDSDKMNRLTKIKITELNPHVICVLCGGYYINATTIVECLHSFCRTCITRYLETSKYCPVCDVMVHKTRPLEYIRSDKTLQDLVYKLVPGLYKSEMKRRRDYYAQNDPTGVPQPPSEDRGTEFHDRIIYTEDEKISLSLELCAEGIPFKTPSSVHGHNGPENIKINDVRYLSCPAAFSVGNLKKFIRMKFDLKLKYEIDVFHTAEPLPDYYTLMDIAYIYTWTRRAPLRLYYTVFECKIPRKIPDPICVEQERTVDQNSVNVVEKQQENKYVKAKNDKNRKENKKRKLLEGPDDIVPDFVDEKAKLPQVKRKESGGQRKRPKKAVGVLVDSSVMEAMSESEEQLAKLTLNSSNDFGALLVDTGDESSMQSDCTETFNDVKTDKEIQNVDKSDIGAEKDRSQDMNESENKTKSQISPGSISLSLFQPLNATDSETVSQQQKSDRGKIFDFVHDSSETNNSEPPKPCGKPGRKKQNKDPCKVNGAKTEKDGAENKSVESGEVPEVSDIPQKKKPGRRKKIESVENGKNETDKKSKVKKPVKVNSETGERVKRKYVRKADKLKQTENENTQQTPTKSKKVPKDECKDSPKAASDFKNKTSDHTCSEINEVLQNGESEVNKNSDCVGQGHNTVKVNTPELKSGEERETICENKITSVPTESLSTPLYGQTPKVTEANQGLPVAPSPPCAENSVSVVNVNPSCAPLFNTSTNICTKEPIKDNNHSVIPNSVYDNGTIPDKSNHANQGEYCSDAPNNNEDLDAKLVIDEGKCVDNGFHINGFGTGNQHFTNIEIPQLCPPRQIHHHGGNFNPDSPCPETNTLNNGFSQMDQASDQPLDLTSNGRREEYMKGKIFKTKMLKRTYMKQDAGISQKDQKLGSPIINGFHPQTWT